MQFGIAEIIGSTGVVLATGVGILQIWLAYVQLRETKKQISEEKKPTDDGQTNQVVQDDLVRRAISNQLQGNLQEATKLVEQAKAIPIDNPELFKLENKLHFELKQPYVDEMSGRVIERTLFNMPRPAPPPDLAMKSQPSISAGGGTPLLLLWLWIKLTHFLETFARNLRFIFSGWFLVIVILLFTGVLYILLKWLGF
jgi:hypothetical protein